MALLALGLTSLVSTDAAAWHHRHGGGSVIIYGGPAYAPVYPYPYYAYPPPVYGVPAPAYVAPPAYISPPPGYTGGPSYAPPAYTAPAPTSAPMRSSECREYQTQIMVGGQPQQAVGVTCRQPDGSWRIITDAAPR
jgi:hypothetical protein